MYNPQDDFFILDSHLVVTETSNSVLDSKVWDVVVPQAALSWQRVLVANWLSSSGAEWAQWIQKHNSGTYNNQYIVVDLNKFSPGSELQPGLLTIVEQMPGLVMSGDLTSVSEGLMGADVQQQVTPQVNSQSGQHSSTVLRTHELPVTASVTASSLC
jgi:hypothetical protein